MVFLDTRRSQVNPKYNLINLILNAWFEKNYKDCKEWFKKEDESADRCIIPVHSRGDEGKDKGLKILTLSKI